MPEVWLATAECGDYYCGCGDGHVVGVGATEAEAQTLVDLALKATMTYIRADGSRDKSKKFSVGNVRGPITVGAQTNAQAHDVIDQRKPRVVPEEGS